MNQQLLLTLHLLFHISLIALIYLLIWWQLQYSRMISRLVRTKLLKFFFWTLLQCFINMYRSVYMNLSNISLKGNVAWRGESAGVSRGEPNVNMRGKGKKKGEKIFAVCIGCDCANIARITWNVYWYSVVCSPLVPVTHPGICKPLRVCVCVCVASVRLARLGFRWQVGQDEAMPVSGVWRVKMRQGQSGGWQRTLYKPILMFT